MPRRASQLALAALLIAAGVLRAEPPPTTATDAAPAAAEPASPAPADDAGKRLYARHCLSCHQADGGGVPNMQPAIAGGTWVKGDDHIECRAQEAGSSHPPPPCKAVE